MNDTNVIFGLVGITFEMQSIYLPIRNIKDVLYLRTYIQNLSHFSGAIELNNVFMDIDIYNTN